MRGLSFPSIRLSLPAFGQRFSKTGRVPAEFHRYLIEGQDSRNIGDYGIQPTLSSEDAEEQIAHAEEFLQLAERMKQE
jgi:uncharacterized protein (UPF0332 family)